MSVYIFDHTCLRVVHFVIFISQNKLDKTLNHCFTQNFNLHYKKTEFLNDNYKYMYKHMKLFDWIMVMSNMRAK